MDGTDEAAATGRACVPSPGPGEGRARRRPRSADARRLDEEAGSVGRELCDAGHGAWEIKAEWTEWLDELCIRCIYLHGMVCTLHNVPARGNEWCAKGRPVSRVLGPMSPTLIQART